MSLDYSPVSAFKLLKPHMGILYTWKFPHENFFHIHQGHFWGIKNFIRYDHTYMYANPLGTHTEFRNRMQHHIAWYIQCEWGETAIWKLHSLSKQCCWAIKIYQNVQDAIVSEWGVTPSHTAWRVVAFVGRVRHCFLPLLKYLCSSNIDHLSIALCTCNIHT